MDYKERWCEIYEEREEALGREPTKSEVDEAYAEEIYSFADGMRDLYE